MSQESETPLNVSDENSSVLAQLAGAELKLSTLLLDGATYVRRFFEILKAPVKYFGRLDYAASDSLKRSIAFMLQGFSISFLILTLGVMLPQSIAGFFAASPASMTFRTQNEIAEYAVRIEQVKRALSPELAKEWFKQAELMLAIQILPVDRFQRMLQRLRELSKDNPSLLQNAINGSLNFENRFGGRGYILTFFFALDPYMGGLLQQTHEMVDIGPKYELKPSIGFLLRSAIVWYLTCRISAWLAPAKRELRKTQAAFIAGAYLLGFWEPILLASIALRNIYLALVLPEYINKVSILLVSRDPSNLSWLYSGLFPFENFALFVIGMGVPVAALGIGMAGLARAIQNGYRVSKNRAWNAAGIGLGLGVGAADGVNRLAVITLAPTGLL